jgi:hypothetical protein
VEEPSGGQTRLADLHVTIAACLTAHALNIGYSPIVRKGVPALERDRLGHVNQNYLGTETYAPANVWLIAAQAGIALAQAWGGGLVAGIDGMRFTVPVPSIYACPNRKYFGSKRGVTWLNMVNDQGSGLAAKVVSGTPGESLHMIDVIFSQDGGQRPDIIVADTGTLRRSGWSCPDGCRFRDHSLARTLRAGSQRGCYRCRSTCSSARSADPGSVRQEG